jgi:peroxiredoxin
VETRAIPSLQDALDTITQNTRALVQPERLALSEQAAAELFASGIEQALLQPGSPAPDFALIDAASGRTVHTQDLLALGPLLVKFIRGRWCPYCVTEVEMWRDLHPELRRRNALIVAVSPQTPRQNAFMVQQHELPFPVLSDPGAQVAAKFGIAYSVPPSQRRYFQSILVNIPFANAGLNYHTATEASWNLPLPATFLIRQDGTIVYAEAHADFRVRPEPAEVLAALSGL